MLETTRMSSFHCFASEMEEFRSSIHPTVKCTVSFPLPSSISPGSIIAGRKLPILEEGLISSKASAQSSLSLLEKSIFPNPFGSLSSHPTQKREMSSSINVFGSHLSRHMPLPTAMSSLGYNPISKSFSPFPLLMNKSPPLPTLFKSSSNVLNNGSTYEEKAFNRFASINDATKIRSGDSSRAYKRQFSHHHESPSPSEGKQIAGYIISNMFSNRTKTS